MKAMKIGATYLMMFDGLGANYIIKVLLTPQNQAYLHIHFINQLSNRS